MKKYHFSVENPKDDGLAAVRLPEEKHSGMFSHNGGWLLSQSPRELANKPLIIQLAVKEKGNYQVILKLTTGIIEESNVAIFSNRRHMVVPQLKMKSNQKVAQTFLIHIASSINQIGEKASCDHQIYITFFGLPTENVQVDIKVEPVKIQTLHIMGDSISADDEAYLPYKPQMTWSGWGQHIGHWLNDVAINNQAHNGMTTVCFRDDGHWQLILDELQPGDIVLCQFGHNDQKRPYLEANGGYATNIRRYIREIKNKGAQVVLVTPLSRIPKRDRNQRLFDTLTSYELSLKQIGVEENVTVINLHEASFDLLCELQERSVLSNYFLDAAHTNDWGAEIIAHQIVKLMQESGVLTSKNIRLKKEELIAPEVGDKIRLDNEQPIAPTITPEIRYRDAQGLSEEVQSSLKKAIATHLIDPCVLYLHPNSYISRGQFLYVLSQVAKPFERVAYTGGYVDISPYEWLAPYIEAARNAKLFDQRIIVADEFQSNKALNESELLSILVRNMLPIEFRNVDLEDCKKIALEKKFIWKNFKPEKPVTRLQCYLAIVNMLSVV
ncbi:GDSL-type esterase/lipase family protein [Latilactobacillus sakei]|uniref:GDSL-type esterase/lipase family protein n=1 Tax=Latilactobacillus sakei TaxID=1599 RepID=UPI003F52B1EF